MAAGKIMDWAETIYDDPVPYESVEATTAERNELQEQFDSQDEENDLLDVPDANYSRSQNQPGKLTDADGVQYIARNVNGETLPYTAMFLLDDFVCELLGDKSLLFIGSDYILRVSVGQITIDDADNFDEAKKMLLNHLTPQRVLWDEEGEKCNETAQKVIEHLQANSANALECRKSAELLFQLFKIFDVPTHSESLIQKIQGNMNIEESLKENLVDHFQAFSKLKKRDNALNALSNNKQLKTNTNENLIKDCIQELLENYKEQLLANYPSKMTAKLATQNGSLCFKVSKTDLKLFSDLENFMTEDPFKEALSMIRGKYITQLDETEAVNLEQLTPMSNDIYFFICKSLMELSKELQDTYGIKKVIQVGDKGWVVQDQPDDKNLLKSSHLQQLKMLVELANHYAPGAKTVNQKFKHTFKIKNATSDNTNEHVWLCFLDGSIGDVFSAFPSCFNQFSQLIDFYTKYIVSGQFREASPESLRTITHQLLKFLTQAVAAMTSADENPLNIKILQNQIFCIIKHEVTIGELRDLLEIFTCHWKQCSSVMKRISDRLDGKIFQQNVCSIQKVLLEIVSHAMVKKVKRLELIDFLRNFYDFMIDLEKVDLVWYVRLPKKRYVPIFMDRKLIELVDNKWKGTEHQCHVVENADRFEKEYTSYEDDVGLPKHYQMVVIETLLKNVNNLASKKNWTKGGDLTKSDQLNAMKLFIGTVRSLFRYLNEQPDYIQFEAFFHDNVQPFVNAIDKSESSEDFSKRISMVKESFWYVRNQNNIGIDDALKLLQGENQSDNIKILKSTYTAYQKCFEEYIKESLSLTNDAKIKNIIENVRSMTDLQLATSWSDNFKQNRGTRGKMRPLRR